MKMFGKHIHSVIISPPFLGRGGGADMIDVATVLSDLA